MRQNRKTNILIFYGPRKEFEKLIWRKKDKEFFTTIVQEHDEEIKSILHKIDGQEKQKDPHIKRSIKNLIINSD